HLLENTVLWIHGCFPELLSIHLTETLIALDTELCASFLSCLLFRFLILSCFTVLLFRRIKRDIFLSDNIEFFLVRIRVGRDLPLLDLIQWRLSDIDVPFFDQRAEVSIKERQKERTDVRAVDVGICGNNDLVIAKFGKIEHIANGS